MKKVTLEKDIKEATGHLLDIARSYSIHPISSECVYILSVIKNAVNDNFIALRKTRRSENKKKSPKTLDQIVADLYDLYEDLYDVNLYVYKSSPKLTIVEIQYYPKSSLDKDYLEKVRYDEPMLHCKINLPPYAKSSGLKFDINWEFGGFKHHWKLFWWNQRIRNEISKRDGF